MLLLPCSIFVGFALQAPLSYMFGNRHVRIADKGSVLSDHGMGCRKPTVRSRYL